MGVLSEYQIDAIHQMKNGCILCGVVGSGKSRTALGYYLMCNGSDITMAGASIANDPPKDLYIITTAKKRDSREWDMDMTHFLLSTTPECNYYHNKIVIDSWNNISKYIDISDAFFIFDEQRVVGKGTWVKSFLKIAKKNEWILLSGTPGDKWEDYIPVFVANGFYRNRSEFNAMHVVWSTFTKYPKISRYLNTKLLEKHRNDILVDMEFIRPTIRHHEYISCKYDTQKYKEMIRNRWNFLEDIPIENPSTLCYLERYISNSDEDRQVKLMEIFEKQPRMIIFYNFDYELDILRNIFTNMGVTFAEWNGHKHQPLPTGESWVYLVQYISGCEGWNCISTNTVVFYSQTYSYRTLEQACGRIDRMNTPYSDLYYYHLKCSSPIDISIGRALANKKNFNESRYCSKFFSKGEKNE